MALESSGDLNYLLSVTDTVESRLR